MKMTGDIREKDGRVETVFLGDGKKGTPLIHWVFVLPFTERSLSLQLLLMKVEGE